ncbi:MAG: PAS domain S-box protein [Deltaproteobacteria bacterium]
MGDRPATIWPQPRDARGSRTATIARFRGPPPRFGGSVWAMEGGDLQAVLRAVPDLYLVLSPTLAVIEASDAWLAAVDQTRESVIGQPLFGLFPQDPADPSGQARTRHVMEQAIADKRPYAVPAHLYTLLRDGVPRPRMWTSTEVPVLDGDGEVRCLLHRLVDVTELVESRHYQRLLDSAPDAMVIVGQDGVIRFANTQAEVMFGYWRVELVGQRLELLIPDRFRPGHGTYLERYFREPRTRSMGSGLELYGRRKNGSELPIEVSLSPQSDETGMTVSAAIRDITDRKQLEREARITNDRLKSAVESMEHAFALFDAADRLVLCNSVYRAFVHDVGPGALVGRSFHELLDSWLSDVEFADAAARERFRAERFAHRREQTTSFDVRMRDGRSLRIIDRHTPEGGIVKTILDRTDDERRAAELLEARVAAEAASDAKSEFLSSMSHELRTPLNAILGFAQLLERDKKEPLSQRHKDRVGQILRGGEHLLRLIDDILDLARIEAGRISVSPEPVGVADVLAEIQRTLEPIATRHHVVLRVEPAPHDLPMVIADRTRFAQILMNFGSNAIKYNRAGGHVTFTVEVNEPCVRITVRDTGFGIPTASQGKLFQPFQRAGQELGTIEGTGIGLVITKRLAELMGGAVGFTSAADEGSAFWVELPARHEPATARPVIARAPVSPVAAVVERRLVLYVEDNPANIVLMRDLFEELDQYTLVTMPTAELGVEHARASKPALVIMDINLPGMSGLDALAVLRRDPATAPIPVIALTAAAADRDRRRGLEAGFAEYLTKPVIVDVLIAAIRAALLEPAAPE